MTFLLDIAREFGRRIIPPTVFSVDLMLATSAGNLSRDGGLRQGLMARL
jgi:hypothetical protein